MAVESLAECSELVGGPFVIQEVEHWYMVDLAFSVAMFGGPCCAGHIAAHGVAVGPLVWLTNSVVEVPLVRHKG